MSNLSVEHRGYSISFATNEEVWRCWTLDIEDKSLAKVKAKINKIERDLRNAEIKQIDAIAIETWHSFETITILSLASEGAAWIMTKSGRREKKSLQRLALVTDENKATIKQIRELREEAARLGKHADKLVEAIPRVTVEALRALSIEGEKADVDP